jgi:hypothetical protein
VGRSWQEFVLHLGVHSVKLECDWTFLLYPRHFLQALCSSHLDFLSTTRLETCHQAATKVGR